MNTQYSPGYLGMFLKSDIHKDTHFIININTLKKSSADVEDFLLIKIN